MPELPLPSDLDRLFAGLVDGQLTPEEHLRLESLLSVSSAARSRYLTYIDNQIALEKLACLDPQQSPATLLNALESLQRRPLAAWKRRATVAGLSAAALGLAIAAAATWGVWPGPHAPVGDLAATAIDAPAVAVGDHDARLPGDAKQQRPLGDPSREIVLRQQVGAVFFREVTPAMGAPLKQNHDYSLLTGQIELLFPRGASAIFEGPALFRLQSEEQVFVSYGACSVYAPDGSEGFEVLTPRTQIIDRGTRFVVKVQESGDSEVHVIEGLVDAVEPAGDRALRLLEGNARRYSRGNPALSSAIDYSSSLYRGQLPDRLVRFQGPPSDREEIERLQRVWVMRGGQLQVYEFDELIGGDVTSFCETGSPATTNLVHPPDFSGELRELFLHDDSFMTGVLNPGGSKKPYTGEVLTPEQTDDAARWTPGMTITFRQPVVNGPGPDILIFDIQPPIHPLEGDRFHVRPLELRPGQRPLTVDQYDINMLSPESLPINSFVLKETTKPVARLEQLEEMELWNSNISLNYRVIGTGIDLSLMGVPEGESVSAIFIQDALDDQHRIDPVMIVGLPESVANP